MKLFFETSSQAVSFLSAVPFGLVLCLCLAAGGLCGIWRLVADLAVLLCASFTFFYLFVFCKSSGLRCYHLLGIVSGVLLCMRVTGVFNSKMAVCLTNKTKRRLMQESCEEDAN